MRKPAFNPLLHCFRLLVASFSVDKIHYTHSESSHLYTMFLLIFQLTLRRVGSLIAFFNAPRGSFAQLFCFSFSYFLLKKFQFCRGKINKKEKKERSRELYFVIQKRRHKICCRYYGILFFVGKTLCLSLIPRVNSVNPRISFLSSYYPGSFYPSICVAPIL